MLSLWVELNVKRIETAARAIGNARPHHSRQIHTAGLMELVRWGGQLEVGRHRIGGVGWCGGGGEYTHSNVTLNPQRPTLSKLCLITLDRATQAGERIFFPNQYIHCGILDSSDWLLNIRHQLRHQLFINTHMGRRARVFTMCYMIRRESSCTLRNKGSSGLILGPFHVILGLLHMWVPVSLLM
jgi:hypothetical protein